jgi:calcium-dependent protein kinase
MGGKLSSPVASSSDQQRSQQPTERSGCLSGSPATSKSPKSPRSRCTAFDDSTTWIHKDVDVEEIFELHEIIAYGHLGAIQICSKKRPVHSTHTGELVKGGYITRSDRTEVSSDSSSDPPTTRKASHHRLYACKTISLSRIKQDSLDALIQEVTMIRSVALNHPNVLTVSKVCYTKRYMWIVTELCTGGDLFSRMETSTEMDVADVLEQLVEAVSFLHQQKTCHCGIQLENVLYEHCGSNAGIKLIDYGLARKFSRSVECWKVCGAEYWVAPEVHFSSTFSTDSDIWSIGVVAFVLLSGGTYPFGTDCELNVDRLDNADFEFGNEWRERKISTDAKEFCSKCLRRNPNDRWTAKEALDYIREWMAKEDAEELLESLQSEDEPRPMAHEALRGLKGFHLYGQLKKRVLTQMANTLQKSNLDELKHLLVRLDTDGTGTMTLEQVRLAVMEYCKDKGEQASPLSKEDIKKMFKGSHQDRLGTIYYMPFMDAVLEAQGMMTQERLGEMLDRANFNDKGWISKEEMKLLLQPYIGEEFVEQTIQDADCEVNGSVEYDTFLQFMFQDPAKGMEHVSRLV